MCDRPSLLMVEDSDLDFELASRAIRQIRPTLNVARYTQCREVVQGQPGCPRLIVLDIHLPDGSGLELIPHFVAGCGRQEHTLVVFSTSNNPAEQKAAMASGASHYYVKPLEPALFVEVVQTIVSNHLPASA